MNCTVDRNPYLFTFCYLVLTGLFGIVVALPAQEKTDFAGDYAGMLGPLHVTLHLATTADGRINGNVDSPDQHLVGLPCANLVINGQSISFTVPAVGGTWAGVLTSDHNLLSGIWSQGTNPTPLNLTRARAPNKELSLTQTPSTSAAGNLGAPTPLQGEPSCAGAGFGGAAFYWDGSAWKQMTAPAVLEGRQGYSLKSGLKAGPFGTSKGTTTILRYENPAARITVGSNPKFVMCALPSQAAANFVIASVDIKKDYREIESISRYDAYGKETWIAKKRLQPVDVKRISDTAVEITPSTPLQPGQYVVAGPKIGGGTFDFGVDSNRSPEQ